MGDLENIIVKTKLKNTDDEQRMGNIEFDTEDAVFLNSFEEIKNISVYDRFISATDYAVMCGALLAYGEKGYRGKQLSWVWLRSAFPSYNRVGMIDTSGDRDDSYVGDDDMVLCPSLRLNLSNVISSIKNGMSNGFEIKECKYVNGNIINHTINFGQFPKSYVGDSLNSELTRKISSLHKTGKTYSGYYDKDIDEFIQNEEYEYNGQNYVYVKTNRKDEDSVYSDGTPAPEIGEYQWVKVEPITWKITNWDDMPKEINPKGSGMASYMDLISDEGIISGIPFYPVYDEDYELKSQLTMWQNSLIRAYLNGYDLQAEIDRGNGNREFKAEISFDFTGRGFIDEMLGDSRVIIDENSSELDKEEINDEDRNNNNPYSVWVDSNPLSVKEQMGFYVESGMSFMLHGPSGVGKSRRVKELSPDCPTIILRKDMLPEEVTGKTAYENGVALWIAPTWYTKLCEQCEREPDRYHALFIDELTNVPANVQSLVYHLVLEHSIEPGRGELPANCIVIAAGNSQDESEAAYSMPEPLFRRFTAHIFLDLDLKSWLEWGSELRDDGKFKIHPLIASFVASNESRAFYTKYDPENPPKFAVDPRGWEQVSDIIYANKGRIRPKMIEDKIGKELTASLIRYAQIKLITVEDIINNSYKKSEIPKNASDKYVLTCSLRRADENQVEKVREFVETFLGAENRAIFDDLWVGDDDERALLIGEIESRQRFGEDLPF